MIAPSAETCDRLAINVAELRRVERRFMAIYFTRPGKIYRSRNIKKIAILGGAVDNIIYIFTYG